MEEPTRSRRLRHKVRKCIHQNIEQSLAYGEAMALPSNWHKNDLTGFCGHSIYSFYSRGGKH